MESLVSLSRRIRDKDLSPFELMQQTLMRIDNNQHINAVVALNRGHALEKAQQADREVSENYRGPLHGIPVTIKDTYATSHIPTRFGIPF